MPNVKTSYLPPLTKWRVLSFNIQQVDVGAETDATWWIRHTTDSGIPRLFEYQRVAKNKILLFDSKHDALNELILVHERKRRKALYELDRIAITIDNIKTCIAENITYANLDEIYNPWHTRPKDGTCFLAINIQECVAGNQPADNFAFGTWREVPHHNGNWEGRGYPTRLPFTHWRPLNEAEKLRMEES